MALADPAPMTKQLKIGAVTYSGSIVWATNADSLWIRSWYANRHNFLIGAVAEAAKVFDTMNNYNPEMEALVYQLYVLDSSARTDVITWCDSMGYDSTDLILYNGPDAGDSTRVRSNPPADGDGFGRYVSSPPDGPFWGPGYNNDQTRMHFDFREPKVGEYLAYRWKIAIDALGYTGCMVDEEFIIGYTNNSTAGNYCIQPPFRGIDTLYWGTGSPYTSWINNWTDDFDLQGSDADVDEIHSYVDIRDSLRRARAGWMQVAGDSMLSWGYKYAPNMAAVPKGGNIANWVNEGKAACRYAHGYLLGEAGYFYPSTEGGRSGAEAVLKACSDVKDDTVHVFVCFTGRCGQYERNRGTDYARSKMSTLGLWLACDMDGAAEYYFAACVKNGQSDYRMNRSLESITEDDTTTLWSYAWTKYWGVHTNVVDSSQTGDDPESQDYKVWKFAYKKADSNDTLTYVIGRNRQGSDVDASTVVEVALPSGTTWYQLIDAGGNTSHPDSIRWEPVETPYDLMNSEYAILSSDTVLSNDGPNGGGGESPRRRLRGIKP